MSSRFCNVVLDAALPTVALYVLAAPRADAYLDPTTGSLMVQVLIGAGVTACFAIKTFWKSLIAPFRKFRRSPAEPQELETRTSSSGSGSED